MKSKEYLKQIATTEVIDCTNNDKAKKRIANIFPVGISAIEKDLEILEIIKTKNVNISLIKNCYGPFAYAVYNSYIDEEKNDELTKEDFNKIKEWLEEWNCTN